MFERLIVQYMGKEAGTLGANVTYHLQFSFPVKIKAIHAVASNDSDATLAVSGGLVKAAAVIGDSGTFVKFAPSDFTTKRAAKDTAITITVDYDGTSGTAADDLEVIVELLTGEG